MTNRLLVIGAFSAALLSLGLTDARSQTCSAVTTPTLNGQHWAVPSVNSLVYVDPNLPAAVQSAITAAVANFQSQTGESVIVAPVGAPAPNPGDATNSQGAIYMMNSPAGSPSALANTSTTLKYVNGQPTNQQINATTNFNLSYALAPNVPAYSPTGTNAATFLVEIVVHELGHAFGMNDVPAPNGDYANQIAGASIMNGYVNTNDQGPHANPNGGPDVPGGVGAGGQVSACDKKQVQIANPTSASGGGNGGSGGGGGGPGGCINPLENCGTGGNKPY